jgi:hypothetical protein
MAPSTNELDWTEFDNRKALAVFGFFLAPIAVVSLAVGFGHPFWPLSILGIVCWVASFTLVRRLQTTCCPRCKAPFTDQANLLFKGWASVRVISASKCVSCGQPRRP